jgi:hypothetical protein
MPMRELALGAIIVDDQLLLSHSEADSYEPERTYVQVNRYVPTSTNGAEI